MIICEDSTLRQKMIWMSMSRYMENNDEEGWD